MQPIQIENALKVNRPQIGKYTGVGLYRIFRLVVMERIFGRGASGISYFAGKEMGKELGVKTLDEFLKLCEDLKIGIIKVPEMRDDFIHVDVYECVTCDGMDVVGRAVCSFEGGLIAGAIESITGKKALAKEVTCIGGLGDESCGFDITLTDKPDKKDVEK